MCFKVDRYAARTKQLFVWKVVRQAEDGTFLSMYEPQARGVLDKGVPIFDETAKLQVPNNVQLQYLLGRKTSVSVETPFTVTREIYTKHWVSYGGIYVYLTEAAAIQRASSFLTRNDAVLRCRVSPSALLAQGYSHEATYRTIRPIEVVYP